MNQNQDIKQQLRQNQYQVSPVPYHIHNNVDSPNIPFKDIKSAPNCFCAAVNTNSTTPVNVFSSTGATYPLTIDGVFLIALDNTAGNISLLNSGGTVATIAKGTSAGVMVGATSLSNTGYVAGNPLTVVSSSAGNCTLFVTFTV